MSDERFLRRWSRMKAQAQHGDVVAQPPQPQARAEPASEPDLPAVAQSAPHPPVAPAPASPAAPAHLPTLDDVAALTSVSDFSAFVTQGVDKTVQRLAMKKLFSDPHFRVMDGLDIYIDDYTKSDPLPAAMLASLEHAKSVFSQFMQDEKKAGDKPARDGIPGQDPAQQRPPEGDA
jgi:hypothetical protein